MTSILILKTGALGDVLRTTSILPGLHERYRDCRITWVTATGAVDLIRHHPRIAEIIPLDASSRASLEAVKERLKLTTWDRLLSFDDEEPLCALASALTSKRLSGAHLDSEGRRVYTPDVAPWFDMGLLSVHGKAAADRMKIENQKSHPAIFAEMLGLSFDRPELFLDERSRHFAREFVRRVRLDDHGPVIGLNTGAGGRWTSKALDIARTCELVTLLHQALEAHATFLLLGGASESARNQAIAAGLEGRVRLVDAGTENPLLEFAALVASCKVLVTSDSLALHVALAQRVRTVAFFAPTSAAEIEMYAMGEKVVSTAPDYCSYRPDADTSTLTAERIAEAVLRQLTPAV